MSQVVKDIEAGWWRYLRPILFSLDAELMHESAINLLKMYSRIRTKNNFLYNDSELNLSARAMGLSFKNPIGLAAGFDVNGDCLPALEYLGFGFIEVGGVTENAQPGNARPRIFRLPKDRGLINRLNFDNKGIFYLRKNLERARRRPITVPIGVNLGKSNFSGIDDVPKEYVRVFSIIHDVADYITMNISCPNSEGLGVYQNSNYLRVLLDNICGYNEMLSRKVPILLKLGPDLSDEAGISAARIAHEYGLSGLVVSNTTKQRPFLTTTEDFGAGGLSGQPLFARSTELLEVIAKEFSTKLTLIGSGGIMDGPSAVAKLKARAHLLQVYTGFIYGGPRFVETILKYVKEHYFNTSH